MRCRIGDRAVIVGGCLDNIGHLVNVKREGRRPGVWVVEILGTCIAFPRGQRVVRAAGSTGQISDTNLWALRSSNGVDETIMLAGLPRDKRKK
jgi:hypothetical protein